MLPLITYGSLYLLLVWKFREMPRGWHNLLRWSMSESAEEELAQP